MRSFGIMLVVVGLGSFLLRRFGVQFILVSIFGRENETVAAIAMAVVGAGMIGFDLLQKRKSDA